MVAVSLIEVIGVGSIFPFVSAILNTELILQNEVVQFISVHLFHIVSDNVVFIFTIAFLTLTILAGGLRLLLLWSINKTAFSIGAEIGESIFRNSLSEL